MEEYGNIIKEIKELGYDFSNLKRNTKTLLLDIYSYKEQVMVEMSESSSKIKNQHFTITKVSERIGCSRTTIYQNDILKSYIDSISEEVNSQNPYKEIEKLRGELGILQETIDMMKKRDAELLLIKRENRELKEQISSSKNNVIQINKK